MQTKETLIWHIDETPTPGNYLILTKEGNIAEAEYRTRLGWFQYRWMVPDQQLHVLAWCRLSDIERPTFEE